jgi:MAF protein
LAQLQLPFQQADPGLDERPWKRRELEPEELVSQLALAKARALSSRFPGALLLGADQVAVSDGEILGKPGHSEGAVEQLIHLSGKAHRLVTGLSLWDDREQREWTTVVTRTLQMRKLTRAQAEEYVRRDSPENCAGSYRFESLGVSLFEAVDGDSSGVVGLPLMAVCGLLRKAGLDPLLQH